MREHFAGYRSHSSLLALAAGVGTMLLLGIVIGARASWSRSPPVPRCSAARSLALRAAFRRRTGGIAFRA